MTTAQELTQIFKDNFVVYYRSHVAHANITGRNFRSDHKLLAGVYLRRQAQIDIIGELLRTLDEPMPPSLAECIADSAVDTDAVEGDADTMLALVKADLEYLCDQYRELISTAELEEQSQIANYAQEQVLDLGKSIWMLRSTLE